MFTDAPPRKKNLRAFVDSDARALLPLPSDLRLVTIANSIDAAMREATAGKVQRACSEFLGTASDFYGVPECSVRVLAARPLRVREYSTTELFGDYRPDTLVIRVWQRTAIRKEITSFGTFLSTLCHEFCHHLDFHRFRFRDSWHTRGFYERTALLYHHARGTPPKKLVWVPVRGRRWRIDWQGMNRGR
jgi:hypothetical protein